MLRAVKNKNLPITYSELASSISPPIHHRNVGRNIGQISILCHELDLPLLSAIVINKHTNIVGEGFYGLLESIGRPTNGKTEKELYKLERKAILECKDWYRLEDHLGFSVGFPHPEEATPAPKYLDARNPVPYKKSVDVLNTCFGEKYLGKHFSGWMRGAIKFSSEEQEYMIWFPKLSTDGTPASSSGYVNMLDATGTHIEEYLYSDNESSISNGEQPAQEKQGNAISEHGTPNESISGDIRLVFAKNGSDPYRFLGVFTTDSRRTTAEYHYYTKIADVADFSCDKPEIHFWSDETNADEDLLSELTEDDFFEAPASFEYHGKPMPIPEPKKTANRIVYPRKKQRAINALVHANYQCEIDPEHLTFIRRNSGRPYTEPHHLVPLSYQDQFSVSLDVEENIVSLCSNCHKQIHYGRDAEELVSQLFKARKGLLGNAGIDITIEQLLSFYGFLL